MREKFQQMQTVNDIKFSTIPKGYNLYDNRTFISPIHTFPRRETLLFTRQIKVQLGKSTFFILTIEESWRLWQDISTSPSFSSFIDRVFSIIRRKKYESFPSEKDIKVVIPAPTQ